MQSAYSSLPQGGYCPSPSAKVGLSGCPRTRRSDRLARSRGASRRGAVRRALPAGGLRGEP
jgi:hypothetical protein